MRSRGVLLCVIAFGITSYSQVSASFLSLTVHFFFAERCADSFGEPAGVGLPGLTSIGRNGFTRFCRTVIPKERSFRVSTVIMMGLVFQRRGTSSAGDSSWYNLAETRRASHFIAVSDEHHRLTRHTHTTLVQLRRLSALLLGISFESLDDGRPLSS